MKKVVIYGLVLFALIMSIVAYHMNWRQDYISNNSNHGYSRTLHDARYLNAYFGKKHYNENNPTNPYKSVLSGDAFILRFSDVDSTLYYHIVEDSPSNMASITCQIYEFNIDLKDKDDFANFRGAEELKKIVDPTRSVVISKKAFTETIRESDVKFGLMTKIRSADRSFITSTLFSPFVIPITLFLCFIVIWWSRRFSEFFGSLVGVSSLWFLGGLVAMVLVLIWWPTVLIFSIDESGKKHLLWDLILSTYTLYRFSAIFLFIGFWNMIRKYSAAFDFADREAFKFFYIFFASIIYWVASPYLHAFSFEEGRALSEGGLAERQFKVSMEVFSQSIIFATANFLNNFRAHYFELRRKGKSLLKAKNQSLESTSELAALQSRVNPHFLYNSMNSIAALAESDPTKTKAMALALSEFYKYSSNRQDKIWSTLGEEIEMIKKYLEIEKIRFGDKLKIIIRGIEETKDYKIPRFLIHPLVENAVKYGYSESTDKIEIMINSSVDIKRTNLSISVSDTGPDFPEDLNMGYGLKSIYKKLKLTYPNSHHIAFRNEKRKENTITFKSVAILIENPKKSE